MTMNLATAFAISFAFDANAATRSIPIEMFAASKDTDRHHSRTHCPPPNKQVVLDLALAPPILGPSERLIISRKGEKVEKGRHDCHDDPSRQYNEFSVIVTCQWCKSAG